jgi:membrane-associated phospholipid phosphatase
VCFAYFLYFAVACWYPKLSWGRRLGLSAIAWAAAATIVAASGALPSAIHDWAPLAYISLGYYISGWLFAAPSRRLEAWLLAWDRRLFGDPTTRFARWPRWLSAYLSFVYTFCFLLLPAGLIALIAGGHVDRADHYWTMVAAADLGAFAPLVAFQTRPPWQIEPPAVLASPGAHALASFLVRNATIGVNTFPSGHVAVSIAIGLAVADVMPVTGAVLLVLAVSIAVACVAGRFHYAVDAVAGAAWSLLVWFFVTVCSR